MRACFISVFPFALFQTLATDGATAADSFTVEGSSYFVIANGGREGAREVQTLLYRLDSDGSVEVVSHLLLSQTLSSFLPCLFPSLWDKPPTCRVICFCRKLCHRFFPGFFLYPLNLWRGETFVSVGNVVIVLPRFLYEQNFWCGEVTYSYGKLCRLFFTCSLWANKFLLWNKLKKSALFFPEQKSAIKWDLVYCAWVHSSRVCYWSWQCSHL